MALPESARQQWSRYFEALLIEAGDPAEARVLKGVFQHAGRLKREGTRT
jgi:hypothetical protein